MMGLFLLLPLLCIRGLPSTLGNQGKLVVLYNLSNLCKLINLVKPSVQCNLFLGILVIRVIRVILGNLGMMSVQCKLPLDILVSLIILGNLCKLSVQCNLGSLCKLVNLGQLWVQCNLSILCMLVIRGKLRVLCNLSKLLIRCKVYVLMNSFCRLKLYNVLHKL